MTIRRLLFFSLFLLFSCSGFDSEDDENDINTDTDSTNEVKDSVSPDNSIDPEIEVPEDKLDIDPLMNSSIPNAAVTFETYNNPGMGWGYKILMDGSVYVNQPHIPAVEGKNGFASEKDAKKIAELVANKVREGISPPTVSKDELRDLGIIE